MVSGGRRSGLWLACLVGSMGLALSVPPAVAAPDLAPAAAVSAAPAASAAAPVEGVAPAAPARPGAIAVDASNRSLSFAAVINLAEGPIEVVIATPKGRLHEALLRAEVNPLMLQASLYALGLNNGPRLLDSTGRRGDLVDIDIEYVNAAGTVVREPVEAWIRDTRTGERPQRIGWVFVGSVMRDGLFLAEEEGNICINYSVGSTILDCPDPQSLDDTLHVVEPRQGAPGLGGAVRVILTARRASP